MYKDANENDDVAVVNGSSNGDKLIVLDIPTDILLSILRYWLTLRDIVRLDTALLNHAHRPIWLLSLKNTIVCQTTVNIRERELLKLNWLSRRQTYCTKVSFRACKLREPAFVQNIKQHWSLMGKNLKCLRFKERCSIASGLMMDLIAACPKLEELCIGTRTVPSFSGDCLRRIVHQGQDLKTLHLTDATNIPAQDWTHLATHCTRLQELNLDKVSFSPTAIPLMLDNMPHLGKLMLNECSVVETMQSSTMTTITSHQGTASTLNITEMLPKDQTEKILAFFKHQLEQMDVSNPHPTLYSLDLTRSKALADLLLPYLIRRCPNVERLNVSFCSVAGSTLRLMGQYWRRLRTLFMPGCTIHDNTFQVLISQCRNIETLVLGFSPFLTSVICDTMATYLHALKTFALWGNETAFTEESVTTLVRGCRHIEKLALTHTNVTDAMLSILVEHCPISRLEINGCRALGSAWMPQLSRHCGALLTHFVAEQVKLDDIGLLELVHCPLLEYVNVSKCELLTNEALAQVLRACPKLSVLRLTHCSWVTDDTLAMVETHGLSVQELDVSSNSAVSSQGVLQLVEKHRGLRRLVVLECVKLRLLSEESTLERIQSLASSRRIMLVK